MTSRRDWLNAWGDIVNERTSRPIIELHLGDSITEGKGASKLEFAWGAMQQKEYEATWPTAGPQSYGFEYVASWYNTQTTVNPVTLKSGLIFTNTNGLDTTASATRKRDYGLLTKTVQAKTGYSFTVTRVATSMKVRVYHNSADTAYSIYINDSTTPTTTVSGKTGFVETALTGLGGGSVKLKVTFTNAGTIPALIDGVAVFRGTENKGFQVWPAAYSGSYTNVFVNNLTWETSITFVPDLITLSWLTNDINSQNGAITPDKYYASTKSLINHLKNVKFKNHPEILFLIQSPQEWTASGYFTDKWANYIAKQRQIAGELDNVLVEPLSDHVAKGTDLRDGIHPNDVGYATYAQLTRQTLSGDFDSGNTTDTTKPTVPANFSITEPTTSSVKITWSASTDTGGNLKGYEIYNATTATTIRTDSLLTSYTVPNLTPNKAYSFKMLAYDTVNNKSAYTAALSVTTKAQADTTLPTGPTTLTASVASSSSISLTWNAASDDIAVTGYRILKTAPSSATVATVSGSTLNYTVTGLSPSTAYTFKVAPIDAAGNQGNGLSRSATTTAASDTTPPSAPQNLAASAVTQTSFTLSWSASTDSESGVAGYNVYQNGVKKNSSIITGTSYAVTGLSAGTSYPFVVMAVDNATNTKASAALTVATDSVSSTPPTAPYNIQVVDTQSTSIKISWSAPSDPGDGIAGYRIYQWSTGTATPVGTTTNLNYTATGLTEDTTYNFVVKAYTPSNVESQGTKNLVAKTDPAAQAAPATPYGLAVNDQTVTATGMTLTWNSVSGATGYLVFYSGTSDPIDVPSSATPSYAFTGLTPGTNYGFVVKAYAGSTSNISAGSGLYQKQTLQPSDAEKPSTPPNLNHTNLTSTSLTLTWDASTDNIGVTSYLVYTNYTSTPFTTPATANPTYQVNNLNAGTSYSFVIKAVDASGNISNGSGLHTVVTPQPVDTVAPTQPGSLTVSSPTQTSLSLAWTASTDINGVTRYVIYQGANLLDEVAGSQTSYTAQGLRSGTSYSFNVYAYDAAGNRSTASNTATGKTVIAQDTIIPTVPTNLVVSNIAQTTLTLSWTASTDNVGVTQYRIYRNSDTTPIASTAATQSPSQSITGLSLNTSYTFVVKAYDAAGNESNGAKIVAQTLGTSDTVDPGVPLNLTRVTTSLTSITFAWTAPYDNVGVAKYRIYQDGVPVGFVNAPTTNYTANNLEPGNEYGFVLTAIDGSNNESAKTQLFSISTDDGNDITAPSIPGNVAASDITDTSVDLSWSPSTDDTGVQSYQILANGAVVGSIDNYDLTQGETAPVPSTIHYTQTDLSPTTTYSIVIRAIDAAGNVSSGSAPVSFTTGQPVVVNGTNIKVWTGSAWVSATAELVWDGSAWVTADMKVFAGSDWV